MKTTCMSRCANIPAAIATFQQHFGADPKTMILSRDVFKNVIEEYNLPKETTTSTHGVLFGIDTWIIDGPTDIIALEFDIQFL